MANIIVTEFAGIQGQNGQQVHEQSGIQAAIGPIASQAVAIGGSTAATANACNALTSLIRVYAEADCNITIAAAPNAGTGVVIPLAAGQYDYFGVSLGSSMKVAVISRTVA